MNFHITRELVRAILKSPHGLKWSAQGLGMLRTYLDDKQRYRLHIWDSSLRVPNVSPIHNHPWHLDSLIVSGTYMQRRFTLGGLTSAVCFHSLSSEPLPSEILNMVSIKCGEGACELTTPTTVKGYLHDIEVYKPGENYHQRKDEVHESLAADGTVTLVDRTFSGDRDTALVLWRGDGGWVDARPRPATTDEITLVTTKALEGFDV